MNSLGFAEDSLASGIGAVLTGVTKGPIEGATGQVLAPNGGMLLAGGEIASLIAGPGDRSEVKVTLTPLQRMIQEILDPLALPNRPVKEWRNHYKSFFAFFAPNGGADEAERKAWAIATDVFNTNLVAVCNRTTQVVPMTFQDFADAVDSFRHDGLREGAQRDIAWQPKKILLLMAAMTGRILAGWQADVGLAQESRQPLFPFRNYLIAENRKAAFLGSVFDYDPRFSILDYGAAGLKPLLQAFPHFAFALMENGMSRCEICPAQVPQNPPLLRAHFLKPLRVAMPLRTLSTLHLALLRNHMPLTSGSRNSEVESSYFESSKTALNALAFEPSEAPEERCSKTEKLFELALRGSLLVCSPHRADPSTAARVGKTLGRTPAEQFVIERFFALGFRDGHGNEPWLERGTRPPPVLDLEKVKKARKQFDHWKRTSQFFCKAGLPGTMDIPGASIREEVLQPKGSSLFLSLLNTPIYTPLMMAFLAADTQGRWVVDDPELYAFARNLNGGAGKVLSEAGGAVSRWADSFRDRERKGVFLFECAVGILLSASGGHKNPKRLASLERAKDALRQKYEQWFAVSLSGAPSLLRTTVVERAALLAETKRKFEEAERGIMDLLAEPLSRKVSEHLRAALEALPKPGTSLAEHPAPAIRLESRTAFEESIADLCAWLKSRTSPETSTASFSARQFLAACVELRELAEVGKQEEALAKASALYPTLSETRKQGLASIFGELAWSLLQAIEQQLDRGNNEKAIALAENAMAIIEGTPLRDEFKSLFQTLFVARPAGQATVRRRPSTAASTGDPQGARAHQAKVLLRDYADELSLAENQLEQEFLDAVRGGTDAAFKRKEKLRNRLQRRTRWGGREPYKTALKLLESITECNA